MPVPFNFLKRQSSPLGNTSADCFLAMVPYPALQPLVSASTMKIVGADVLLWFQDDEGTRYPPGTSIEHLEKSDYINTINADIINHTHHNFNPVASSLPTDFFFIFTITASQLTDRLLKEAVLNFSERFNLVLKLAGHSMFSVDDIVLDAMDEMTREGIQFALGDVGAGNNSLRYLEGMDFTFASISHDLTLCHNGELPYGKTLSALLELGRTLNVTLIAEGIQNDEHAGLLTTKGFRLLQRYADAHPLSASHFISQCLRVPSEPSYSEL